MDKDIIYEKHRMVCYFFETIQELWLVVVLMMSGGFDDEWRLQAESLVDLFGDDGDADGDVVVD